MDSIERMYKQMFPEIGSKPSGNESEKLIDQIASRVVERLCKDTDENGNEPHGSNEPSGTNN